jgi:hypothetical protein
VTYPHISITILLATGKDAKLDQMFFYYNIQVQTNAGEWSEGSKQNAEPTSTTTTAATTAPTSPSFTITTTTLAVPQSQTQTAGGQQNAK